MRNPGLPGLLRFLPIISLLATGALADANPPVVSTREGAVRGVLSGGIDRFLGIPYAAPPVGALRWQPPQPAARWNGVRDATQFGNHCPQLASPFGLATVDEDCLFLNVFAPVHGGGHGEENEDERLPVMVWIHGGALLTGESDDYD